MSIRAGEAFQFEQEVVFSGHYFTFVTAGQAQIVRGSDGFYWNAAIPEFQAAEVWNATMPEGSYHSFEWTVPTGAADGDTFTLRMRAANDPATETVGTMIVRAAGDGSGGVSGQRVFDGVDFATGFPSTFAEA